MAFRPLHDRVLVRRVEQSEKTAGGIIIPDTAKEKPSEGEVIAAGPGSRGEDGRLNALDVKKGDRILFGKWSGTEVKIDGEDLIIMKESDILGVVEPTAGKSTAAKSSAAKSAPVKSTAAKSTAAKPTAAKPTAAKPAAAKLATKAAPRAAAVTKAAAKPAAKPAAKAAKPASGRGAAKASSGRGRKG